MQAQDFGGREGVGARRGAGQALVQEVQDGLGPRRGVVAAGGGGRPSGSLSEGEGAQVIGKESVEAAAREAELRRGGGSRQFELPEGLEHMADEGWGVTMGELLILFKRPRIHAAPPPWPSLFVSSRGGRLHGRPSLRTGLADHASGSLDDSSMRQQRELLL